MAVATHAAARRGTRLALPRMLRQSLLHRRSRSLSALLAMTVSAAVATALLTLYSDLDAKLHREFRGFGANVVVAGAANRPGDALPPDAAARVQTAAGADATVAPFAYAVATTDRGTPVVVAGMDVDATRRLNTWWKVDAWPGAASAEAVLGQKAANFVADEHAVKLTFAGRSISLRGVGRLRTGGDEDSRIYLPMSAFTAWTGVGPGAVEVQVPGGAAKVEAAVTRMRSALPGLSVNPVRALVEGENRIVDRTRALMFGSVVLIALTVGVSVLATMSASVLERRRDFALMRALGGSQGQLLQMFLLEALLLAGAGVVAGWIVGSAAAWVISEANFDTATLPRLAVVPPVLLLNLVIAAIASVLPARVLRGLEPAALLKGE